MAGAVRIEGGNPAPGHATTPPARVFWLVLGGRDPPGQMIAEVPGGCSCALSLS